MHEPSMPAATSGGPATAPASSIDQQLAAQDGVLTALAQRLAAAAMHRSRFSCRALYAELGLEAERPAARDVRGALLYDRSFARRQH